MTTAQQSHNNTSKPIGLQKSHSNNATMKAAISQKSYSNPTAIWQAIVPKIKNAAPKPERKDRTFFFQIAPKTLQKDPKMLPEDTPGPSSGASQPETRK